MVEALLLDSLLALTILLLIPLGVVRGGLREVCSSAGILLGIMIAQYWAPNWGDRIGEPLGTDRDATRFVVAVVTVLAIAAIIGYGAGSSFSYHPGPGGKMFGAAIAVINGLVLSGFVVNSVATHINNGSYPQVVEDGWFSRALSRGFDWVLLVATVIVLILSLMGTIVREREPQDQAWAAPFTSRKDRVRQVVPTQPYLPAETEPAGTAPSPAVGETEYVPVKVREVRHWEDQPPVQRPDTITGWQQTWPKSATGDRIRAPWEPAQEPARPVEAFKKVPPAHIPLADSAETLRQWVAEEDDGAEPKPKKS